jgi:hypothetical protein
MSLPENKRSADLFCRSAALPCQSGENFEDRSWRGLHHHPVLSAVAYLFILIVYLRHKKNSWCDVGTDSPHDPALAGEMERTLSLLRNRVQANVERHDLT